ncbi:MAG: GumC family protein [Flavobacteriaceae bacterium]
MTDQQETLSIGGLLAGLWRARWKILLPTFLAFVASVIFVSMVTPTYRASARVLIEDRQTPFNRPEAENKSSSANAIDELTVRSQVQALTASAVVEPVIEDLDLKKRGEFNPALNAGLLTMIKQMVGLSAPLTSDVVDERIKQRFYDRYSVFQLDKSRVIEIEFNSEDPVLAAEVPNRISASFIEMQKLARSDATADARTWLGEQVDTLRESVAEAERKVEQFRAEKGLFNVAATGEQGATTLSTRQLSEISTALSDARARRSDATARARLIRESMKTGTALNASDVLNSQLIQRLIEQKVNLQAQIAELSSTLLSRHPRIRELSAQAADLDRQIRQEADRIVKGLESEARIAAEREVELQAQLDALKTNAAANNEDEVQLRALQREAAAQRELLEIYLSRYREAAGREKGEADAANARLLSPASVSTTPYFPRKAPLVTIATVAMFIFACGINVLSQLASAAGGARREDEAEGDGAVDRDIDTAEAHVLSREPAPLRYEADPIFEDDVLEPEPEPAVNVAPEPVRATRTEPKEPPAHPARCVLVAPVQASEATYSAALQLARSYAGGKDRVLLLDSDFGRSGIERHLDLVVGPGLADLIAGKAQYEEILHRDPKSRLHIIGAGRPQGDPALVAHSPLMDTVLDALAETYSTIVIVSAPVSQTAEGLAMARHAREAMLVLGDGVSDAAMSRARDRLAAAGVSEIVPYRPAPAKRLDTQTA